MYVFVVAAGLGLLTEGLALLLAGDEGPDGDAVLPAHDTLGRGHVHLHRESLYQVQDSGSAYRAAAGFIEEALRRFSVLSLIELIEVTPRIFFTEK